MSSMRAVEGSDDAFPVESSRDEGNESVKQDLLGGSGDECFVVFG